MFSGLVKDPIDWLKQGGPFLKLKSLYDALDLVPDFDEPGALRYVVFVFRGNEVGADFVLEICVAICVA